MTPVEYILDPRYETIGCAFKWGVTGKSFWVEGPDIQKFYDGIDPNDTMTVSHNAPFDASIAAWRYGFVPKLIIDTLGVSRAVLGHLLKSHSLDKVAHHLGIGGKTGALIKAIGMRLADLKAQPTLYSEYVEYALNDTDLCAGIYEKLVLSGIFPASEIVVMDSVIRCVVQPKFRLNQQLLVEHHAEVVQKKEELLATAMLAGADGKSDLMSNDRFAELLREVGVDPPMKISLMTGRPAYAFAKSDQEFVELLEHENPAVQALVSARIGHKSTLEESRTQRFIDIANLSWPGQGVTRAMPVPLRYAAAHTHRLGGDWQLNLQNLPSRGDKGKQKLKLAMEAPDGYVVYAPDSSQIEARGVAEFCGQTNLAQQFRNGEDVYASFASLAFGFPVNKNDNPVERFIGKTGVLGLGYSVGWEKFIAQVKIQSRQMLGTAVELPESEGRRIVQMYRTGYPMIPAMWKILDNAISTLANGGNLRIGPLVFRKGEILLPNGLKLKYENLRRDSEGTWRYDYGTTIGKRLYGGALLENIMQALARIIIMDASTRVRARTGESFAIQVHDQLGYVIPKTIVHDFVPIVKEEMRRPPLWMPGWPLAEEGDIGPNLYGEAA